MTNEEKFDLSKIEKLEGTINVALISVSTFAEIIIDSELRSYNKYYPIFDYENKCIKMIAPLSRVGRPYTLVLPFKDIVDECGDEDNNSERAFFELGLLVMEEMKERVQTRFKEFKENIQKKLEGKILDD